MTTTDTIHTTLNGHWRQTRCNDNGEEITAAETGGATLCEFRNGEFCVRAENGEILLAGTYRLNADTQPHTIDWTDTVGEDKGKTFLAIFTLTDNTFTFVAADEDMARPVSFEPQTGHTIRTFHRI